MDKIKLISTSDLNLVQLMPVMISALNLAFSNNQAINYGHRQLVDIESNNGILLSTPFFCLGNDYMGAKVSTIFRDNPRFGRSLTHSLVTLFSTQNGTPTAIINGNILTSLRTGAVGGLAADYLASPKATKLTLIGSGNQAFNQAIAILAVRPKIKTIAVWSRNKQNAENFISKAKKNIPNNAEWLVNDNIDDAVLNSDIICTATSKEDSEPLIKSSHLNKSCHINVIGGSSIHAVEIDPSILRSKMTFVEDVESSYHECGEIKGALSIGKLSKDEIISLFDISKKHEKKSGCQEITVFRSVGTSFLDSVASDCILKYADENKIGRIIYV